MRPLCFSAALTIGVAATAVLGITSTAHASLSGSDWTAATIPDSYMTEAGVGSPVSCVQQTGFCVVITDDSANLYDGDIIGDAALVTTDGGQVWSGYPLPALFSQVNGISCVSASTCWAAGEGLQTVPALAETTDGGKTWTNMTPAAWASAQWSLNALDCVSAATCWVTGVTNPGNPWLARTSNGGTTWSTFTQLPGIGTTDPASYGLFALSCTSAMACVAVGGPNQAPSEATVLATGNGGRSWSQTEMPGADTLWGVSCVQGSAADWFLSAAPTCVAVGSAGPQATESVVVTSHDGGRAWSAGQDFNNGGWFNSAACVSARDCWVAGGGTTQALIGTSNGGSSWTSVTADTTNEAGYVSCLSRSVCVASVDNGIYVTTNDGGLAG